MQPYFSLKGPFGLFLLCCFERADHSPPPLHIFLSMLKIPVWSASSTLTDQEKTCCSAPFSWQMEAFLYLPCLDIALFWTALFNFLWTFNKHSLCSLAMYPWSAILGPPWWISSSTLTFFQNWAQYFNWNWTTVDWSIELASSEKCGIMWPGTKTRCNQFIMQILYYQQVSHLVVLLVR